MAHLVKGKVHNYASDSLWQKIHRRFYAIRVETIQFQIIKENQLGDCEKGASHDVQNTTCCLKEVHGAEVALAMHKGTGFNSRSTGRFLDQGIASTKSFPQRQSLNRTATINSGPPNRITVLLSISLVNVTISLTISPLELDLRTSKYPTT